MFPMHHYPGPKVPYLYMNFDIISILIQVSSISNELFQNFLILLENGKKEIVGFRKVGCDPKRNDRNSGINSDEVVVAELFHGPTLAFKVHLSVSMK